MDRMACVDVLALPLQLLLRDHPEWREHPAAVIDRDTSQGVLVQVNEAARRRRILPGMRATTARALDHELRAGTVPDARVVAVREEIVAALRVFAPGVEPSADEPGVFWLDASGLGLLHPSLERWARLVVDDLAGRRLRARIAVGFTRFGTYALARQGRIAVQVLRDPDEEMTRARAVPLARLDLPPDARDALHKLGIERVDDLVRLPRNGVRRRFGDEVVRLVRLATGDLWTPLQPVPAREPVRAKQRLDHGERDLDRFLAVVGRKLPPLLRTLAARQHLLQTIELRLHFEKAECRTEHLQPAAPTLQSARILELVRLRLEGRPLEDEVVELELELHGVAGSPAQTELFDAHVERDPAAGLRALARLRAELGDDAVRVARLTEGHLPEARFRWDRCTDLPVASPRAVRHPPLVRRILPRPVPLSSQRRHEPDGWMILGLEGGAVEEVIGPYVIEGAWWHREVHRELHYVRTAHSGWLWVYFDRRRRRWFQVGSVE